MCHVTLKVRDWNKVKLYTNARFPIPIYIIWVSKCRFLMKRKHLRYFWGPKWLSFTINQDGCQKSHLKGTIRDFTGLYYSRQNSYRNLCVFGKTMVTMQESSEMEEIWYFSHFRLKTYIRPDTITAILSILLFCSVWVTFVWKTVHNADPVDLYADTSKLHLYISHLAERFAHCPLRAIFVMHMPYADCTKFEKWHIE